MNVKKSWLEWFVGILLFLGCILGTGSLALAGPRVVLPENSYEFSSALEGSEVSHDFVVKNQGDEPLKIFKISSG